MDRVKGVSDFKVNDRGSLGIGRMIRLSLKDMAEDLMGTVFGCIVLTAASLPLFVLSYHEGSWSTVGYLAAGALGAWAWVVICAREMAEFDGKISGSRKTATSIQVGFIAVVLSAAVYAGMTMVSGAYEGIPEEAAMILNNSIKYGWKPIAHVNMAFLMIAAIVPSLLVAVPLSLRHGWNLVATMNMVSSKIEDKNYSWMPVVMIMGGLAGLLAWIPLVGALAVVLSVKMSIRLYRHIL